MRSFFRSIVILAMLSMALSLWAQEIPQVPKLQSKTGSELKTAQESKTGSQSQSLTRPRSLNQESYTCDILGPMESMGRFIPDRNSVIVKSVVVGGINRLAMYPFEVLTTQLSVNGKLDVSKAKDLYRGLVPNLSFGTLKTATSIYVNEKSKKVLEEYPAVPCPKFVAGALAGASEVIWNPANVIRQDLQSAQAQNVLEVFQHRTWRSFYYGTTPLFWRNTSNSAIFFPMVSHFIRPDQSLVTQAIIGGTCSALAAGLSWPFEWARVQLAMVKSDAPIKIMPLLQGQFKAMGGPKLFMQIYRPFPLAGISRFINGAILGPTLQAVFSKNPADK